MVSGKSFANKLFDAIIAFILIASAMLCIAPIINTLAVSFSDKSAAEAGFVTFWPVKFTLASYEQILKDPQFVRSFFISVERVLLGCTINFVIMVLMAYPLSRSSKHFPGRNIYMWVIVFTMLFSGGLIPWFLVINQLGLVNSIWALVLPGAVPVFNVILLMNFFKGVPKELEEAAVVDGAGPWFILLKIFIPVSLPAIATVMLFQMVWHWNSFFDGLILMNTPQSYPLQTYVYSLTLVAMGSLSKLSPEEIKRLMEVSSKTFTAAKIFVTMIPVLAIYPFMQKYFIKGIVMGAVKE
jgi:putative aldouronate transport system permease protein